jgi:hypothetical protein
MWIGWLVSSVGTFGSVREIIEVSAALCERGHEATIYHPHGDPCKWLPYGRVRFAQPDALTKERPDVLMCVLDPAVDFFAIAQAAKPKVRAMVMFGFEPTMERGAALRGELAAQSEDRNIRLWREAIERGWRFVADSPWQVAWLREQTGIEAAPPFGGVNTRQFRVIPGIRQDVPPARLLASGDPRWRKGTETVTSAWARIEMDVERETYWGKRYSQTQLVEAYNRAHIFCDGHLVGGWCNPVLAARACGAAVVCTATPCTEAFREATVQVPMGGAGAMAYEIRRLIDDEKARQTLAQKGVALAKRYDYSRVAADFEAGLQAWL